MGSKELAASDEVGRLGVFRRLSVVFVAVFTRAVWVGCKVSC